MLIGTAGHIDHGKTTLIGALTGVNTDRLPEEKRRGISIDLGYAYLPAPDGSVVGFIDVPGHERFVPTMLAGATGIDCALLVIAADDGPMPQTREHLDILRLLGVEHLLVALTKIDRVDTEQRALTEIAISELLVATPYAGSPLFAVAAPTGVGVAALRDALFALSRPTATQDDAPNFRLAIDRSFAVAGAGTVVTGTVHAGRVAVGDMLQLAKKSDGRRLEVRVRSLHANNRNATEATRGIRCALNLVGVGHQEVERGDWVVSPGMFAASHHIDIRLDALPAASKLLRPGIDLHVHHGAQHLMGRLVALDEATALFQLVVATPLLTCHGDRLILRDASGQHTLGGASVIDPAASQRHRRSPARRQQLQSMGEPEAKVRLAAFIDASPFGVDLHRFSATHNARVNPPIDAVLLDEGRWAISPKSVTALTDRVVETLRIHHEQHPDELGLGRDRIRRIAIPQIDIKLFSALLDSWLGSTVLARQGAAWHLPTHRVELTTSEKNLAEKILSVLLDSRLDPPWVRDLSVRFATEEAEMRQLLRKLSAQGQAFQIVRDLFFHHQMVALLSANFMALASAEDRLHRVKAASFRDQIGLGRKRTIQILEFFDRVGFTRRVGIGQQQAHTVRGDAPGNLDDETKLL